MIIDVIINNELDLNHAASLAWGHGKNRARGKRQTLSHLPSPCWVQTALLETHLQNHNLQKRGQN